MGNNSSRGFGFNTGGGGGGGTDTNIANSNLTSDGNYATDLDGNNLIFKNGINKFFALESSTNAVSIGNTTPYTMPTARSGAIGKVLQSTDVTTGMDWKSTGFTLPFTIYMQGIDSETWHYPVPMSNNKFLALAQDSGLEEPGSWNVSTLTTVTASTLGMNRLATELATLDFWASAKDNLTVTNPLVIVEIWKIPLVEGTSAQLTPQSAVSGTSAATGDNSNKFYKGSGVGGSVTANTLLMPVFRLDFQGEVPDTINFDVWINGSINCYYTE